LSKAVIVVEGAIKSGSLITASLAADQGRDVYAVPGNINQPNSVGCNKLISEGAFPIMDLEEVISVLGIPSCSQNKRYQNLSPEEKRLFLIVKQNGSLAKEILFQNFGGLAQNAASLLTILELKGFVKTEGSKIYVAK
jgi:DNA processing protein